MTTEARTTPPADVPALFSARFALDPEPTLRWLRTHDPVHHDPGSGMVVLTRHADCAAALVHPMLSAAGGQQQRTERSGAPATMLSTDGVEHQRLRRPAMSLLGPGAIARVLPDVGAAVDAVLARLDGTVDIGSHVSEPCATAALGALLGLHSDDDLTRLDEHARAVAVAIDPVPDPATAERGRVALAALDDYLDELIDCGGDAPLHDLAAAPDLTRDEVKGVISLAMVGGWSPLAELLTTALELVCTDRDRRVAALDPGRRAALVEEVLRWHTPIPFVARRALVDVELPSGTVPSGSMTLVMIGAADRDDAVWNEPDHVDTGRGDSRRHLAFGAGPHFCMGAALVRAVVPQVLERLLRRYPESCCTSTLFVWRPGVFPRRPFSAQLRLDGPRS